MGQGESHITSSLELAADETDWADKDIARWEGMVPMEAGSHAAF